MEILYIGSIGILSLQSLEHLLANNYTVCAVAADLPAAPAGRTRCAPGVVCPCKVNSIDYPLLDVISFEES